MHSLLLYEIVTLELMQPGTLTYYYVNIEKLQESLNTTKHGIQSFVAGLLGFVRTGQGVESLHLQTKDYYELTMGEKELSHLGDVVKLYQDMRSIMLVLLVVVVLGILFYTFRKRGTLLAKAFLGTLGLIIITLLCVLIVSKFRVMVLVVKLHKLVFTNDNWVLDSTTEFLVKFFSKGFYTYVARFLAIRMCLNEVCVGLLCGFICKKNGNWKGKRQHE